MPYKPLPVKSFHQYLKRVGWKLRKGKMDWNLYDEDEHFICSIKIAHGKKTKQEVVPPSVKKVQKAFETQILILLQRGTAAKHHLLVELPRKGC